MLFVKTQFMQFHPVIFMPADAKVFDLTHGIAESEVIGARFGIGRYNEKRLGIYTAPQYAGERNIHMGIDLFAPQDTPVYAFENGRISAMANNARQLDYGYTLVTEHEINGSPLYALHGHLSARSIEGKIPGQTFRKGDVLGWLGDRRENGGWVSHLHFQLSTVKPTGANMPGVVSDAQHAFALELYPDPRCVLGTIYK